MSSNYRSGIAAQIGDPVLGTVPGKQGQACVIRGLVHAVGGGSIDVLTLEQVDAAHAPKTNRPGGPQAVSLGGKVYVERIVTGVTAQFDTVPPIAPVTVVTPAPTPVATGTAADAAEQSS